MTVRSGSESRKMAALIGVRVDVDLAALLRDRAARADVTPAEYTRRMLQADLLGMQPLVRIERSRVIVSDEDRVLIGTFSRSAGLLAGALVLAAKTARHAGLTTLHADIERMLAEVRDAKAAALRIQEAVR
jgi:hypothetical protein